MFLIFDYSTVHFLTVCFLSLTPDSFDSTQMAKPKLRFVKKDISASRKLAKAGKQSEANKVAKKGRSIRFKPTFTLEDQILLVGEGNFSFSLSVSEMIHGGYNMTATTYDSRETMLTKYPKAEEITGLLEEMGATIHVSKPNSVRNRRHKA
jgi:Domain of unknown function (DUF2431)